MNHIDYIECEKRLQNLKVNDDEANYKIIADVFELKEIEIVVEKKNIIKYYEPFRNIDILKSCSILCLNLFYKTINEILALESYTSSKKEQLLKLKYLFSGQAKKHDLNADLFFAPHVNFINLNDVENTSQDSILNFPEIQEDIDSSFRIRYSLFHELSKYCEIRLMEYDLIGYKNSRFVIDETEGKYFLMEFIIALEKYKKGYIIQEVDGEKLENKLFELFGLTDINIPKIRNRIKSREKENTFKSLRELISAAEENLGI